MLFKGNVAIILRLAARINGNKTKSKTDDERKTGSISQGFELAPQLLLGQYATPHTTGPCEHYLV